MLISLISSLIRRVLCGSRSLALRAPHYALHRPLVVMHTSKNSTADDHTSAWHSYTHQGQAVRPGQATKPSYMSSKSCIPRTSYGLPHLREPEVRITTLRQGSDAKSLRQQHSRDNVWKSWNGTGSSRVRCSPMLPCPDLASVPRIILISRLLRHLITLLLDSW